MLSIVGETPEEKAKLIKQMEFEDKCDRIATVLINNLINEIELHHGNGKLAKGIVNSLMHGLFEIDRMEVDI